MDRELIIILFKQVRILSQRELIIQVSTVGKYEGNKFELCHSIRKHLPLAIKLHLREDRWDSDIVILSKTC